MKKIILLTSLIGLISFTLYHYLSKPNYSSEIIFEPSLRTRTVCFPTTDTSSQADDLVEAHINCLKSRSTILKTIEEFSLDQLYSTITGNLVKSISNNLEVQRIPNSNSISITYHDKSEEKSQQIAFALIQTHAQGCKDQQHSVSASAYKVLEHKIKFHRQAIKASRIKFLQVSEQLGIETSINEQTQEPSPQKVQLEILSAEDLSRYNLAKGEYETELKNLHMIQVIEEIKQTEPNFRDRLLFHKNNISEEVSDFMSKRRTYSTN